MQERPVKRPVNKLAQIIEMGSQSIAIRRIVLPNSVFQFFTSDNTMRILHEMGGARMPQVRALATDALQTLGRAAASSTGGRLEAAHEALLARDIRRFLERPAASLASPSIPVVPPGPPIGEPAVDDLRSLEPYCAMIRHGNDATRVR